jgi:hypothetical protein
VLLTEHLANKEFRSNLDKLEGVHADSSPKLDPSLCGCGCGQAVAADRKFVNQTHYNRARSLSVMDAEQLLARFRQGVPKHQLVQDYGISMSAVKRLIRRNSV